MTNPPLEISLRPTTESDLNTFFIFQSDEQSNYMAAFTPENPYDRDAYMTKWKKLLQDNGITMRTIVLPDGTIVGSVLSYMMHGETQISYWIDRQYWGRGIATAALKLYLKEFDDRPIYGRAIMDNMGSRRVLEKNGFEVFAYEKGYANARKQEVDELVYVLR